MREFGFPRKEDLRKKFKWKKMNFTTDLPKNDPLCSYLVATGRVGKECYRMHVVVNSQEYSKQYRQSEVLRQLRHDAKRTKSKLLAEDRQSGANGAANSERIILCHVLMRTNCPHQPHDGDDDDDKENNNEFDHAAGVMTRRGRPRTRRSRSIQTYADDDGAAADDNGSIIDGHHQAVKKKRGRPPKLDGPTKR